MTVAANHQPTGSRLRGMAGRAVGWWLAELRAAYDDAAGRLHPAGRSPLTIEAGERYWILRQRQRLIGQIDRAEIDMRQRHRALVDLIPPARRRRTIIIDIPPERVLSKIVSLPAAARAELDRILEFELARHFPFPAERVFFRHRVLGRGDAAWRGSGPIEVELIAVPRDIVAEICDELAGAGLRPSGIAVSGGGDDERLFLPAAAIGEPEASSVPAHRRFLLAIGALAVIALISWPLAQQVRLAAVDAELAALQPQARAALDARDKQRRGAERIASVLRLGAERPPLVGVLDRLSRAIPDGTWLVSLGLTGRELVIDGLSPSAAALALALEQSRAFAGVVFRSQITRDPATGLEHFQLGATLAGKTP